MNIFPIDSKIIEAKFAEFGIKDPSDASIREIVRIANSLEKDFGTSFIRMEMGVPGLPPPEIGTEAEIAALRRGVASKYPMIEGIPEFKTETAKFAKLFLDIDVSPSSCIPSVGSMQGAFAVFMVACRRDSRTRTLFIDPGFPVQKQQHRTLGLDFLSFDAYSFRGDALRAKLDEMTKSGDVSTIVYSNPNNPSWICLTEKELRIIAECAEKNDIIVVEDLAYFAMDFRKDCSVPGQAPFQPTIAKFTDKYVLLVSSSKVFSYAGQRIGAVIVSDSLFRSRHSGLQRFFSSDEFGHALVYGALYSLSSGTAHSPQYAVAAMLHEANHGRFNFVSFVREYGERSAALKKIFESNSFKIVYDKDEDKPIADGFYFTLSYPGLSGGKLISELLRCGISAIGLKITGSEKTDGIRACVSQISSSQCGALSERLQIFDNERRRQK